MADQAFKSALNQAPKSSSSPFKTFIDLDSSDESSSDSDSGMPSQNFNKGPSA